MKKLFLATTALVVLAATSAGAADMYARPAAYAPPPPPYSWTGVYFGGNVGYGWGTAKDDATESTTVLGLGTRSTSRTSTA
jgi:outer membrane immunogenic protein